MPSACVSRHRVPPHSGSRSRSGAAEALSGLFSRGRLSDCFDALADAGHLELSPEALVVSKEFGPLFSDEEADFCLQALLQAGFYG